MSTSENVDRPNLSVYRGPRNPQENGSDKGPLRKIIDVVRYDVDMGCRYNLVIFDCGHEGKASKKARKGRCPTCKELGVD